MTSVNIRLDKELHRQAKVVCAMRGITLSEFIKDAIDHRIDEDLHLLEEIL